MKTERVLYSELRQHAPYYEADPLTTNAPPNWVGHEVYDKPLPDTEVYTCYESWARTNPWVQPAPRADSPDQFAAARAFFGSADEWLR